MKQLLGAITLLLMACAQQSMATDKSIYYGEWTGKAGNTPISLTLLKKNVSLTIGGTKINQKINCDYSYSKISPYPFLTIMFTDEHENEHLLYAVIGTSSGTEKTILTGFYERSHIIPDSDGELESTSEQLEMLQQHSVD